MKMEFPQRIYTAEEHRKARELIEKGYKHDLKIYGRPEFKQKVKQALDLIRTSEYYEFLRTYIREILEIEGLTQLRETEVSIWANRFAVENPVDAASLLVQKAFHAKEYLEGEVYYGGTAEKRSVEKRIEFLKILRDKSKDGKVRKECERLLEMWRDGSRV